MNRLLLIALVFLCAPVTSLGQMDHTLYGFRTVPQSIKMNPAMRPYSKVNTTLIPAFSSFSVGANTSGLVFNDLSGTVDATRFEEALDRMKDRNFLSTNIELELLHAGFKLGKNYFSASATERARFSLVYPADLVRLVWEGNGKTFLGERANMDNLALNAEWYREYGVGVQRTVAKSLHIGARVKYVTGFYNVNTRNSQLGLYTDSLSFDLALDGAFELNTSGIIDDNADDLLGDTSGFQFNPQDLLFTNNNGFGLDVGIFYEGESGLNISASVINIGQLTWREKVKTYDNADISFNFSGVPIDDILNNGDDSSATSSLELLQDSLTSIFGVGENENPYNTALPTQGFISFNQSFFDILEVGVLGTARYQDQVIRMGVRASGSVFLGKWLGFSMNYGVYGGSFVNVGAGLSLAAGPVQFYAMSDNVLAFIRPYESKNGSVRVGFNLVIGKEAKAKLKVRA